METYDALTIKELRVMAKDRGVKSSTTMNKAELVQALEALDAEGDPANFANFPDEVTPAPDGAPTEQVEEAAETTEPEPIAPSVVGPEPEAPKVFKLMNDIRLVGANGMTVLLKAGREMKETEHDLERVRSCGGVLAPVVD